MNKESSQLPKEKQTNHMSRRVAAGVAATALLFAAKAPAENAWEKLRGPEVPDLSVDAPNTIEYTVNSSDGSINPDSLADMAVPGDEDHRGVRMAITGQAAFEDGVLTPGEKLVLPATGEFEQKPNDSDVQNGAGS